jgi:hypothetical protein
MLNFKKPNNTELSTDDRTTLDAPDAELEGESIETEDCPDPTNCTPPMAPSDSRSPERAAA